MKKYFEQHKELVLILSILPLLCLLYLTSDLMLPGHPFYETKYMHLAYIKSAERLTLLNPPPFSWRLLQPAIINVLPFNQTTSFLIISFLSLFLTSVLIFKTLLLNIKEHRIAYLGVLFFLSIVWAVRFNVIEFWYPEPLFYFLMMLAVYLIYRKQNVWLSLVLLLGVLAKETMLVVIPLYYFINIGGELFKRFSWKLMRENIIIGLPALITFIVLTFFISETSFYTHSSSWFDSVFIHRIETLIGVKSSLKHNLLDDQPWILTFAINWYRLVLGAFGGFILLILLRIKTAKNIFYAYMPLVVFTYLQLFIAYDIERLIVFSFFPIILAAVLAVRELVNEGLKFGWFILYAFMNYAVQLFFTKDFYVETFYSIFAQNVITILFIIFLFYRRRKVDAAFNSPPV